MLEDFQPKPRVLWLAALVFFVAVVADSWFRWWSYQYGTFDLAFYTQSLWLMLHGQWHVSLLDVPLMGNHAEPICFLLLPFFWIWQSPMFFVVVQALMLSTMPFTAYRIARRLEFERTGALWMALATLLAPATGFIALHEFHPEALAAPLLLLVIEARQAQRPGSYWVFFILAAMCKENVALLLAWMCVVNWVLDRENGQRWQNTFNFLPGLAALGWVMIYAVWLAPGWNGGKVDYLEIYSHLGRTGGEIAGKAFTGPLWTALWNGATGGTLIWGLLIPFLFLPLLRPRWLLISIPIFAQHLLSNNASEWSIHFHHAAPLLPLIWMGTVEAAANMFWRENVAKWIALACGLCQITVIFGPLRSMWGTMTQSGEAMQRRELRTEMLSLIPADASAMVGEPFLSHVAKRKGLHALRYTLKGIKTLSRTVYTPPDVDVVMVDADDSATFDPVQGYYHPTIQGAEGRIYPDSDLLLHRYLLRGSWRTNSVNAITTYRRGSIVMAEHATGEGRKLDDFHSFVLQTFTPKTPGCLGLLFTWDLGKDRQVVPWAKLILESADGRKWYFDKGPILPGKESGRFPDEWIISPDLPAGKYNAQLIIQENPAKYFDAQGNKRFPTAAEPTFQGRRFNIGELSL